LRRLIGPRLGDGHMRGGPFLFVQCRLLGQANSLARFQG